MQLDLTDSKAAFERSAGRTVRLRRGTGISFARMRADYRVPTLADRDRELAGAGIGRLNLGELEDVGG